MKLKSIYKGYVRFLLIALLPALLFSACATLNSGDRQPEITTAQWQDAEGGEISETTMRAKINLSAQTKDLKDKTTVTIKIYPEGSDPKKDKPLKVLEAPVKSNEARIEFDFWDLQSKLNKAALRIDEALYDYYKREGYNIPRKEFETYSDIKEKPKYFFTASAWKCADAKSESVEVSDILTVTLRDAYGKLKEGAKIIVTESDGTVHEGITDENGKAVFTGMIPSAKYNIDY